MNLYLTFLVSSSMIFNVSFLDASPIVIPKTGVKLFKIEGYGAVELQVPSSLSCAGDKNVTWIKDVELNQVIQCHNGSCWTVLDIEQPSDTGNYSCCIQNDCSSVYVFANDGEQLLVEEDGLGMVLLHLHQSVKVTIPCTPTSSNVTVELRSATSGRDMEKTKFGVEFSPFKGFIIERPVWDIEWTDLVCIARLGSHSSEVIVKIFWSPAPVYPLHPVITSSLKHVVGKDIRLNCSLIVEKGVMVKIVWMSPKSAQTPSTTGTKLTDIGRNLDLITNILTIKSSHFSDSGLYRCEAFYLSQSSSTEIEVSVLNHTKLVIQEKEVRGYIKSEILFHIRLNQSLNVESYSWSKSGKVINDSRFQFNFEENMVQISLLDPNLPDSGTYELCLLIDDGFDACYIFHLTVSDLFQTLVNPSILLVLLTGVIAIIVVFLKTRNSRTIHLTPSQESIDYVSSLETMRRIVPSELILDRRHLTLENSEIGRGNFGSVSRGTLSIPGNQDITVAVKRVKKSNEQISLLEEIVLMSALKSHPNIVNMIGAVTHPEIMILVEFCPLGNLKDFLINNNTNFGSLNNKGLKKFDGIAVPKPGGFEEINQYQSNPIYQVAYELQTDNLVEIAIQIASGMKFLATRRIIHRDLAARNVLLVTPTTVKICDFGLSKNCYDLPEVIYRKKKSSPLPYKWMAIESIVSKVYSTKSDVWSYGIVLWELFTLGQDPYPDQVIDKTFLDFLEQGYRLATPELAPKRVAQIMVSCWSKSPEERPDFDQIYQSLIDVA